jgi:hypothetical protein
VVHLPFNEICSIEMHMIRKNNSEYLKIERTLVSNIKEKSKRWVFFYYYYKMSIVNFGRQLKNDLTAFIHFNHTLICDDFYEVDGDCFFFFFFFCRFSRSKRVVGSLTWKDGSSSELRFKLREFLKPVEDGIQLSGRVSSICSI